MKHHYVPKFLLRRWTDAAGNMHRYRLIDGHLKRRNVSPASTGYLPDLYSVSTEVWGVAKDHIEKEGFFGPIDNNAANALCKLERRITLAEKDHIAWTVFLCSLRGRQPDVIEFLRTDARQFHSDVLATLDSQNLPAGGTTTEQWFNSHFPGAIDTATFASWLPRMILNDEVVNRFGSLKWWCREFLADAPKLLLSDLPLQWERDLHDPGFFILLPIGPDRIFFGTASEETEDVLSRMPAADMIYKANRSALASCAQYFWAAPGSSLDDFVNESRHLIGKNFVPFKAFAQSKLKLPIRTAN